MDIIKISKAIFIDKLEKDCYRLKNQRKKDLNLVFC